MASLDIQSLPDDLKEKMSMQHSSDDEDEQKDVFCDPDNPVVVEFKDVRIHIFNGWLHLKRRE